MIISFVFNKGRHDRLRHALSGCAPTEFFLSAIELANRGYDVRQYEVDLESAPRLPGGMVNKLLRYGLLPEKLDGGALEQTYKILPELQGADCVICTTSGIGFALGLWKKIGLLRSRLVTIHCGILNNADGFWRNILTDWLLKSMQTILYGNAERVPLEKRFPGIRGRVHVCQFGVDTNFWHPGGNVESYILAVGNDGRRDFDTLVRAAQCINREILIITRLHLGAKLPGNVKHIRGSWHRPAVTDEELRRLYQNAFCLVVPLKESFQPSGQSVTLQAMACGCPVVLTKTTGLWSSSIMRDGYNVLLMHVGDHVQLANIVNMLSNDQGLRNSLSIAGRETVVRHANIGLFVNCIESFCYATKL